MRILGAMWLFWVGCSAAENKSGGSADSGGGSGVGDTGDQDIDPLDDTGDSAQAVWWTLGATIQLTKGAAVPAESGLVVALLDAELAEVCTAAVPVLALEASKETPDPSITVWWQVTPDNSKSIGCEGETLPLPGVLGLGVGVLHPDIRARLVVQGLDDSLLLGAYAAPAGLEADDPLYVYGAAGTAEAWLGKGIAPDDAAPLADGLWELRPLSTFEVEP